MSGKVSINGVLVAKEQAVVSVYDHGLLYGDGVFEGMRSYNGRVFRLQQHLRRLWESARSIWLEIPITQEAMAKAVNDTLAANGIKDGYIRLVVTRGVGTLGLDPNRCGQPQVIIITDHITMYPKEFYENGLEIVTAATMRNHPAALNPLSVNGSTLRYPIALRRRNTSSVRLIVAWSVPKPMYSANVQSWTETLLTGTPCPLQSGGAAVAVPAVPSARFRSSRRFASAAARRTGIR